MKKPTPPQIDKGSFGFVSSQVSAPPPEEPMDRSNLIQLHISPIPAEKQHVKATRSSKRITK
jgi:hypothetical protein